MKDFFKLKARAGSEETNELYEGSSGYEKPVDVTDRNDQNLDGISFSKTKVVDM